MGFDDVEYGLDNPRFIRAGADPNQPGTEEATEYYEKVWQVFHLWVSEGRSHRDCRIAELLAMQDRETGTVRGISRALRSEGLAPWSTSCVQVTIREIKKLVLSPDLTNSIISAFYSSVRHGAA